MEENNKDKEKNGMPRFNLTWLYVILLIVLGIAWFSSSDDSASKSATYTEFKEYVEKGYANKIVANKDEGSLKMYVTTEHIRDVFKSDAKTTGLQPYITVQYGSMDKLDEFLEQQTEAGNFKGDVSFERANGILTSILFNIVPILLFFFFISTGTISSLNLPSAIAFSADFLSSSAFHFIHSSYLA